MDKSQNLCVEALSLCAERRFFAAPINYITQERMPVPGKMDPDLMSSSSFQSAFDIGIVSEAFKYLHMGDSMAAIRAHSHFFPVRKRSTDRL